MQLRTFIGTTANLTRSNRMLSSMVVALSIGYGVNTAGVFYALNHHTTVLIPPSGGGPLTVTPHRADQAYLSEVARYISNLAWNYSPGTARSQFNELLRHVHEQQYQQIKTQLYDLAARVEKSGAVSSIHIQQMAISQDRGTITLTVRRLISLPGQSADDRQASLAIHFLLDHGRFKVTELQDRTKE